ncbi:MAG: BPTD_3080 family restriction endonuclease [Myxococcota bacterium]
MPEVGVSEPILCSPYDEPTCHWVVSDGVPAEQRPGRRPSTFKWLDGRYDPPREVTEELPLVKVLRPRVVAWRDAGYPGVTRTTSELLDYWSRDGRAGRNQPPLFFAQREAVETVIFLVEARADFRQGVVVPRDEPSDDRKGQGYKGFDRTACKMATGSGKTTVMAMLAAWSILNKVTDRRDPRFSDTVLVVCPNVTIRERLQELDPQRDEASLYRTRDLVPRHWMDRLRNGRVLVTNWHVFEPKTQLVGDDSARVVHTGVPIRSTETIHIGPKTTYARGKRYWSLEDYERHKSNPNVTVQNEILKDGSVSRVIVEATRYVESDTAIVHRVLGREVGSKGNILVFNDEAHHAYRIRQREQEQVDLDLGTGDDEDEEEYQQREATVWVDGLDRIHKLRGICRCVDLSATPFFLAQAGAETGRPFPWVVSDFGLYDAIESGLVKVPQLAVRDATGTANPAYFNIYDWVMTQLTGAERGGGRTPPRPEAILKWAHTPLALMARDWEEERRRQEKDPDDPRPPVLIVVCRDTKLAKVVHAWIAEGTAPDGIRPLDLDSLRNTPDRQVTIRVDSKVVHDTDAGTAGTHEARWMRWQLDTVGLREWRTDPISKQPLYPEAFIEVADKLGRPYHPPGRDLRCIVSVGMLTEGWDCCTVTHVVGLRPFQSQLLCEQVMGRALRRRNYDVQADGRFAAEVAKLLGVPFRDAPTQAVTTTPPKHTDRKHVHPVPDRTRLAMTFPRVIGYTQAVQNRIRVDWTAVPPLALDPLQIPPEVELAALVGANDGRPKMGGPGGLQRVDLERWRQEHRLQQLEFELARTLTRQWLGPVPHQLPVHVLFPQMLVVVQRYLEEKVTALPGTDKRDAFLSPYYGWIVERLSQAIRPDRQAGETPEVPRYEESRGPGTTADVDFWTTRPTLETTRSHVNLMVADTNVWEQAAAMALEKHAHVVAYVKNEGLGFGIPYVHDDKRREYMPDFLVRFTSETGLGAGTLILETKGYDRLEPFKVAAARRWVDAVNADGRHGRWAYQIVKDIQHVVAAIDAGRGELMAASTAARATDGVAAATAEAPRGA